jgi:type VI secretion system protein
MSERPRTLAGGRAIFREQTRYMTLRLRIVSEQRRLLGDRSSIVLGMAGATIGRSVENDWVLPDPMRYVSARHARIIFHEGQYFFEDVSTNGSYVNDSPQPLGRVGPHCLQDGDRLRLGEYHIEVALDAPAEALKAEQIDIAAAGAPTSVNAVRTIERVSQTDIGASLNLNELLIMEEPVAGSAPRPVPGAQSLLSDEPTDSAIQRRLARLAKAVERQPRNGVSAAVLFDVQSGLQAFCRGAGVDPERLPADAQTRLMHLVGQLFREALVGLKDLDRARSQICNRFRIDVPADPDDPRPSLTRLTVEELMVALFSQHETRSIDAVQWLREALSAAKEHENNVAQAMRTAFVEFLDRLDPAELEARFERAARRGKAKSSDRAQYWELYTEFYRNLIEMPADHLPHTFVEAFATAYRELMKKPPQ